MTRDIRIGKGRTRAQDKARTKRYEAKVKRAVRVQVWALSCGLCGLCGRPMGGEDGEMHERVFRSHTRGMVPERRYSIDNCLRVHAACHRGPTGVHE